MNSISRQLLAEKLAQVDEARALIDQAATATGKEAAAREHAYMLAELAGVVSSVLRIEADDE